MEASTLKIKEDYLQNNPKEIICDKCGSKFEKPLFATISAGEVIKEYYACPRCLSKIITVNAQKPKEEKEMAKEETPTIDEPKVEKKKDEILGCKNELGYLGKRPKNTPIPEECFICNKMIDCMVH